MLLIPYAETVTVIRVITDEFGDRTDGETFDVEGCIVYPRMTSRATNVNRGGNETTVSEDLVAYGMSVLMPPGTDVLATDRMQVRGMMYEVDGNPTDWSSPLSNFQPGREVLLKQVTG